MTVKLRLARGGSKKRPFYRIVAADERAPRDGRYIEKLGHHNPLLPKGHEDRYKMDLERVQYWLGTGAQPTDRMHKLLVEAGVMQSKPVPTQTKQHLPKAKTQMRMKEAEEAKAAAAEAAEPSPAEEPSPEAASEEAAPAEETPVEEAPADDTHAEPSPEPSPEAPTEEAPAEEKPAEEAPKEDGGEEKKDDEGKD